MAEAFVPLVILTGFLGAGKTTLLNRVLGAQHHRRIAVIVNELGRIDIDGQLLRARAGDVVELAGGCVCHEVRTMDELWDAFAEVIGRGRPDCIVLETTGIAEPEPLLRALADPPPDSPSVRACRVITVVDAEAGLGVLERHSEARAQVQAADRILLSKLDRCDAERLPLIHAALARLHPGVERAGFPDTGAGTAALVPWFLGDLSPRLQAPADGHGADGHGAHPHQHGQLSVVALTEDAPLAAAPLLALCERLGASLVRAKGFVHIHGEPQRMLIERAGQQLHLRPTDPWPENSERRSEIVLIGEGLDAAALERQLWACRVPRQKPL